MSLPLLATNRYQSSPYLQATHQTSRQITGNFGLDEPQSPLARLVPVAVPELLRSDADAGWEAVTWLLNHDHLTLTQQTAHALTRYPRSEGPLDLRERVTLRRLLQHEDETTRRLAVHAVWLVGQSDRAGAAELLLSVSFEHSPRVANDVFSAFGRHGCLSYDDLGEADRERLLTGIVGLDNLDEYGVQAFLSGLSASHPETAMDLLKRRLAADADAETLGYQALPEHWQENLRFRETERFDQFLADALEWIAHNIHDSSSYDCGALFAAVAVTFDANVLKTLDRAIETGTAQQVKAVGMVLAHVPRTFVWDHRDFVVRAIRATQEHDKSCRRKVRYGLERSVRSGGFSGAIGEPFPQDIEQRDRSRAIAVDLPKGSPERAFYDGLVQSAEASIRWEIDADRRFLEYREW